MVINFLKNITIRKFWFLKLLLNKKQTFLYQTGWIKSFQIKRPVNIKGEEMPWLVMPLLYFLEEKDLSNLSLFEYGAGNSTIYFKKRLKEVVSVEHHALWYEEIRAKLKLSTDEIIYAKLGSDYVNAVSKPNKKFDIILVDGRKRVACCEASLDKITEHGVLVLDDSERSNYKEVFPICKQHGYKHLTFWGTNLGGVNHKSTTIFYKDGNVLGI